MHSMVVWMLIAPRRKHRMPTARACRTAFFGATTAASLLFVLTLLFVLRNFLGT